MFKLLKPKNVFEIVNRILGVVLLLQLILYWLGHCQYSKQQISCMSIIIIMFCLLSDVNINKKEDN